MSHTLYHVIQLNQRQAEIEKKDPENNIYSDEHEKEELTPEKDKTKSSDEYEVVEDYEEMPIHRGKRQQQNESSSSSDSDESFDTVAIAEERNVRSARHKAFMFVTLLLVVLINLFFLLSFKTCDLDDQHRRNCLTSNFGKVP